MLQKTRYIDSTKPTGRAAGFTLIEILVVVVIMGILAAIIVPRVMDQPDQARVTKAKSDIQSLVTALEMYKLQNYNYPSTDQGLQALLTKPDGQPEARNWKTGGYIDRLPKDPWDNSYKYLSPGAHGLFDVFSLGADGVSGGEGIGEDIGSWTN
ncbi:MAG: type II secretion system major pseudopilin GspG [Xanthomonadales bacterium]|nr:type II secretion system major pseudopilin GspG [Xanthomonadales bacterium]